MTTLSRRGFVSASLSIAACGARGPQTPLAHLYGQGWVRGAYAHYADAYARVETKSREQSHASYRTLGQRGVGALQALQSREVPFFIRVSDARDSFRVERHVPERLTFTSAMSQADRERATAEWQRARESIQHDYEEVRRLDGALTELLSAVNHVRLALDEGKLEQFRLCRSLGRHDDGGELPFELPYQVTVADYRRILLLLLERLDADGARLRRLEASMVATGLVARAADDGSSSLATNLNKVLLSVEQAGADVDAAPRAYPDEAGERRAVESAARLRASIEQSPEYRAWLAAERAREDVIGQFLSVMESLSGVPVSSVYRQILRLWSGTGDYLDFLRIAASLVPGGSTLSTTLTEAVERTEQVRRGLDAGRSVAQAASLGELPAGLVNVGTASARSRVGRQLVFYENQAEVQAVREALAASSLGVQ